VSAAGSVITSLRVRGPLLVGHTWDADDATEPVCVDPDAALKPGTRHLDARCPDCHSTTTLVLDEPGAAVTRLVVVEHQRPCPWLTAQLRRNGPTRGTR
jgi:hypothetical protein